MRRWLAIAAGLLFAVAAQAQITIQAIDSAPASPLTVAAPVQLAAQATASAPGTLEYRWEFGDGTPRTGWLAVPTVGHAYLQAGVYTVLLQVRHPTLGLASATRTLVVRLPLTAPAPGSGPIQLHPTRREVWVANPDHGSLGVIDADALVRVAEVEVGANPTAVAIDAFGQVWACRPDEDMLVRIDPVTRTVTASVVLAYGARPVSLLFDAAGQGYVALAGRQQVQRFDAASGVLGPVVTLDGPPDAMALRGDGSALFVSRLVSAGDSGTVWRIALPGFVAAEAIALALDTTSPDSGTAARGLPNYVGALALAEDGQSLWYGGKKDNILRGVFREGQPLTFESSLRALLGRIDGATASERLDRRMDLDDAGRVSALRLAPGSSHLFAAQETNQRVLVLDPWNRAELGRLTVGRAPRGLVVDALTGRLFVQAFLSRRVDVFDVDAMLREGSGAMPQLAGIDSALGEPLSPQVLRGKQVFHDASDARMAQDGYFSCAACHLDGRGDGRTWDFTQLGEGLRNTTSLRGNAGMGRGLVHWSGNFDEIQDFEVPIRNLFGGLGFLDDADWSFGDRAHPLGLPKAGLSADLDALAAYVASLDADDRSPYRADNGALTTDAVAGRALFAQLGCQRCHAGADFTDSAAGYRHDVGTLTAASGSRLGQALVALDTPTLRGLAGSAPYLHDGSAATLDAVLVARNPDGLHGAAAALTPALRAQLVAFLQQIDPSEPAVGAVPQLAVVAPVAGSVLEAGMPVHFAVTTDLPQVVRVDYRVGDVIVASATAPPWSASWVASGHGPADVHADVLHDGGQYQTLSPPVRVSLLDDPLFGNGFEAVP